MPRKPAPANPDANDTATVAEAAAHIRGGGVVAYPTEAVYGLGCDPANEAALAHIIELKRRPDHKGFILIAAEASQLAPWLGEMSDEAWQRCLASWPGPATWIVPAGPVTPLLSGGRTTLAVRVTAHQPAADLCRTCATALVSTSANISGKQPARSLRELRAQFGESLTVMEGRLGNQTRPTTIRDALTGETLRA